MTHTSANQPSAEQCDLLLSAKWIIPVIPKNKTYSDCSLVITDGKISAILPTQEAKNRYQAKEQLDLGEHIITPGLINAHGHAAMSLLRGYADDLPLDTWLNEHIWPAEGQHVSANFVKEGTQLAIAEMIRSGTTCFSDMYFFPDQTAAAAHDAGIRCQITFPVLEFPSAWGSNADDYISKGLSLRDQYRSHELIKIQFGPHAPYTVSDETFARIAVLAPELQSGIQVHLHETKKEVTDSENNEGKRPIQRLFDLNVLTPLTQCVHMTELNDDDIALIKKAGAHIIHCPESNLKLASGFCPAAKLLENGINVALGTDGCASNNNLDMFGEMHTAALLGKAVAGNAAALSAHQTLEMATINGAKAMGIDNVTGSLEVGKDADIIAIKIDPLEQAPLYDPLSQLVYTHNGHRISHSWVKGKSLMQNRQLMTLNEQEIIANSKQWQDKIQS
ncbi:MAG: TRZ/ATZ family hydrolase [Cellvibrionaceae bacterium]